MGLLAKVWAVAVVTKSVLWGGICFDLKIMCGCILYPSVLLKQNAHGLKSLSLLSSALRRDCVDVEVTKFLCVKDLPSVRPGQWRLKDR